MRPWSSPRPAGRSGRRWDSWRGSSARAPSASRAGQDKVEHLRELGFDAALDHRAHDFKHSSTAATPDGIDVYFENVGGHVWDAAFPRLNAFARIPVCGLVAHYNDTELPPGPDRSSALMSAILRKSLTVRGFIQNEFVDSLMDEFLARATGWVQDGSLKYCEDIVDGLENAPDGVHRPAGGQELRQAHRPGELTGCPGQLTRTFTTRCFRWPGRCRRSGRGR